MLTNKNLFGVDEKQIKSILINSNSRKYGHKEIAKVCELFISGCNHNDISIIVGCSLANVGIFLTKHYFRYNGNNGIMITLKSKV